MSAPKQYCVSFEIDVTANDPEGACKLAWETLTRPDAMLPIGHVEDWQSETEVDVDLQDLADQAASG
jgi:hypothetical protein